MPRFDFWRYDGVVYKNKAMRHKYHTRIWDISGSWEEACEGMRSDVGRVLKEKGFISDPSHIHITQCSNHSGGMWMDAWSQPTGEDIGEFSTWSYKGEVYAKEDYFGTGKEHGYIRKMFECRIINTKGPWGEVCEAMKEKVPDSLWASWVKDKLNSKSDIDWVISECLDLGVSGLYIRVYSHKRVGYPSSFGPWVYQNAEKKGDLHHHKYHSRIWNLEGDWDILLKLMLPDAAKSVVASPHVDVKSITDIDNALTRYENKGAFGAFIVVYEKGWVKDPTFGEFSYDGEVWGDGGLKQHKYISRLFDIDGDWTAECLKVKDKAGDLLFEQGLITKPTDIVKTICEDKGILGVWIIAYSKGFEGDLEGMKFGEWSNDGIDEKENTGQQSIKYISRVWDIPTGMSWESAGTIMIKNVPETIEGSKIVDSYYEDKGPLGLWVVANTEYKLGWSFSDWGLVAATADDMQSQIMGLTRSWEEFMSAGGCEIMKKELPDVIGGRTVKKETAICFQSVTGVYMEVQVEPGIPWYYWAIGAVAGIGFVAVSVADAGKEETKIVVKK